jgi:triosephosphate isomerase
VRRSLYAANWKMFKTGAETRLFFEEFLPRMNDRTDVDIMIAPPFTSIIDAIDSDEGELIIIAAQNMHFEPKGAFTGEISASMLVELGCSAVILGHSERRHIFGETDEMINKKIAAATANGLMPVFCIGEKIEQRQAGKTEEVLDLQVTAGLKGLPEGDLAELVVAYEPVWAIGTGLTATPDQAQEAHQFIRGLLGKLYGDKFAKKTRILYGGSVKPSNIAELMAQPDLDGVLVGGASLEPDSFAAIVEHA